MQYMEQFGVVGYSLVMKPDGKLLNSSTMKGEEFLHSNFSISQKFSTFCGKYILTRLHKHSSFGVVGYM